MHEPHIDDEQILSLLVILIVKRLNYYKQKKGYSGIHPDEVINEMFFDKRILNGEVSRDPLVVDGVLNKKSNSKRLLINTIDRAIYRCAGGKDEKRQTRNEVKTVSLDANSMDVPDKRSSLVVEFERQFNSLSSLEQAIVRQRSKLKGDADQRQKSIENFCERKRISVARYDQLLKKIKHSMLYLYQQRR